MFTSHPEGDFFGLAFREESRRDQTTDVWQDADWHSFWDDHPAMSLDGRDNAPHEDEGQ